MPNLLASFKQYLLTLSLSAVSRKLYASDTARFLAYLGGNPTLDQLKDPQSYQHYLDYLRTRATAPSLLRRTTASLRQFDTYLTHAYGFTHPFLPVQVQFPQPISLADKYIKLFTNYLTALHLSPLTIKSYKSDINRYLSSTPHSSSSSSIRQLLSPQNVKKYLNHLADSQLASAMTIERKAQSLARFHAW